MAKGNMFLGMARGKVGDVVFYRNNGQQLSRVRNRKPYNPRSNPQLYQRAIMATVVQMYSVGKEIFDHSFEGLTVGAGNQREFLRRNTKLLRSIVAADINTPIATNSQKGRVVAPGVSEAVPNAYIISRGSYPQNLFSFTTDHFNIAAPAASETVAAYAERVGLIPGDIYTIVSLAMKKQEVYSSPTYDDALAAQLYSDFMFVRLIVKADLSSEAALTTFGQLFDIEVSGVGVAAESAVSSWAIASNINVALLLASTTDYTQTGCFGIIRSRRDADLRSNSEMFVNYGTTADDMYGLASDYLLPEWQAGSESIGDSSLILEGGGF